LTASDFVSIWHDFHGPDVRDFRETAEAMKIFAKLIAILERRLHRAKTSSGYIRRIADGPWRQPAARHSMRAKKNFSPAQRNGGRMYVVVVASQKGGSGKTTLSGHLGVEAQNAGFGPVALIDTDPQGSLSQWWDARKETTPFFVTAGLLDLGEAVEHLREGGVQLVVIDTPPAITVSISQAIAHADLVIIPTRPSPHDLRALGATVDIVERHDKALIFVVNAATPRARITGEAAVALSQHGTVAPVTIHHRVDFAASMVDGRTTGEVVPTSASAKEIQELWRYVQDRLSRVKKEAKPVPSFLAGSSSSAADLPATPGMPTKIDEPAVTVVPDTAPNRSADDSFVASEAAHSDIVEWQPAAPGAPTGLQSFGKRRAERAAQSR
jgi:chromosome partitioning protein